MASKELQFLDKIGKNFLLCTICTERYKDAKCLPCLHNFCKPCLVRLAKEGTIICPVCTRSYQLPGDGIEGIGTNFFLNELVETFNKRDDTTSESMKCMGCEIGESTSQCIECAISLCDICIRTHKRLPLTRSHRLVTLDEYNTAKCDDPASVQPPMYCPRHQNYELEFYCDTCDGTICLKCTAIDHPLTTHKYRCVNEVASDYRKELADMIDKVKVKETEAKDSKIAVEDVSHSLDNCFTAEEKKLKTHITKTVDDVTRLIHENGNTLLKEMKGEYDERKVNLNAQLKGLDIAANDLTNAREYTDKLVQYGNAAQLMSAKKGISTQMAEILKVETKTDPAEDDCMEFRPCDDFCTEKSLGVVVGGNAKMYKITDIPQFVRVDEDITVTLTTDAKPQRVTHGGVDAVVKRPDNSKEEVSVRDNKDGTMTLKTHGKMEGEHELSVNVDKKPVQGSPVRVKVIPKKGLVSKFGVHGSGVGQLYSPWGVTKTTNGNLLVCEYSNNRLQSFSREGEHKSFFQFQNVGNPINPYDAAVSVGGNIFITDNANKQILVCDEKGKLIRCFGKGKCEQPMGITISPSNGRVYVVDHSAHCIHIYNQDGKYFKSFGSQGNRDGQFSQPSSACIDEAGNVYVSDNSNHRVQVFDSDGHFLYSFGNMGNGDGQLNFPRGLCLDKHGYVYVADRDNNRVVKFESNGKFIGRVDSDEGGRMPPMCVCVSDDEPFGDVIVTYHNNHCVKVFAQ
ncbi:tripartite motif-containing protein 2-like [Glandiceps talaboti]